MKGFGVDQTRSSVIRPGWAFRRATAAVASLLMLLSSGCHAEQPWPLWQHYCARYLDDQGRVIDHNAGDRTTTEGEAYAMFFALVTNDRVRFSKLLDWTEKNLAQGDLTLHLPAWSWGKASDGSWHALDTNPAADADLWMAYTLCEAGRLWHVERYSRLGELMADRIAHEELVMVPSVGTTLLPGAQGFHPTPNAWYVNPSYMPPSLIAYFAHHDPQSPWSEVAASLPAVTQSSGGFAMDWMLVDTDTGAHPSAPPSVMAGLSAGQAAPAPVGSFDAIRVYLWAGIADPNTPHLGQELSVLPGMSAYLRSHGAPPQQVGPEGQVFNPDGPSGFSAAVVPYLRALGQKAAEKTQQDRMAAMLDPASGLYGHDGLYYDQNLALFEEGWASGRYRFDSHGDLHLQWK
jgi:endoglucanase